MIGKVSFTIDGAGVVANKGNTILKAALERGLECVPQVKERRKEKAAIVGACPAGLSAACSTRRYLQGEELTPFVERNEHPPNDVPSVMPTEEQLEERHRPRTAQTYSTKEATEEASRCLRCDLEAGE